MDSSPLLPSGIIIQLGEFDQYVSSVHIAVFLRWLIYGNNSAETLVPYVEFSIKQATFVCGIVCMQRSDFVDMAPSVRNSVICKSVQVARIVGYRTSFYTAEAEG